LQKVKFHKSCLLFLFLAVITGQFYLILLSFLLLFVHECGHFFTACLFKWDAKEITFYPFGGIAKFSSSINCPIIEELLVLIMGPVTQCVFYLLFKNFVTTPYQLKLLTLVHYNILVFNLLPIYPLDGGRIIEVFLCYFIAYQDSYKVTFFISYLTLAGIFLFFLIYPSTYFLLMFILILLRLVKEKKYLKYYYEKFFLERYLKSLVYKKRKIVKSDKKFRREYSHIIKRGNWYQDEQDYLKDKYVNRKNTKSNL